METSYERLNYPVTYTFEIPFKHPENSKVSAIFMVVYYDTTPSRKPRTRDSGIGEQNNLAPRACIPLPAVFLL